MKNPLEFMNRALKYSNGLTAMKYGQFIFKDFLKDMETQRLNEYEIYLNKLFLLAENSANKR